MISPVYSGDHDLIGSIRYELLSLQLNKMDVDKM